MGEGRGSGMALLNVEFGHSITSIADGLRPVVPRAAEEDRWTTRTTMEMRRVQGLIAEGLRSGMLGLRLSFTSDA